ncbi:MAG: glycosyltransferase family 4 protein [Oscillospiraceae bacterium]|nr:glycosyltransferase family 4 protein [Oscillospiraceae bacterium]
MIGHKRIPSREGGVEVVVESLAVRMADMGHSVTAYNRRGKHVSGGKSVKTKEYKGIRIKNVPTFENGKLNAVVYSAIATFLAIFGRYDVIHFHAEGPCSMLWLPHFLGIHTVATIHGLDWRRAKWGGFATKFLKFGEKTAAKYADKIIVLSEGTKDYFKETYGRETVFLPNGVDIHEYLPPEIINEKYGLQKDKYILFLARIVPEKGLHYLIEAFSETDTDIKLVVAGGASHTAGYEEEIRKMAASDNRIIFTGFVEGDELWELYHNCRLYVLPSDVEGMPLTLLEAMGCGCDCLVSDIETVKSVENGYGHTFKSGDVRDLKEKLTEILNSSVKDKTEQIKYIRENYSWDNVTGKTVEIYKE